MDTRVYLRRDFAPLSCRRSRLPRLGKMHSQPMYRTSVPLFQHASLISGTRLVLGHAMNQSLELREHTGLLGAPVTRRQLLRRAGVLAVGLASGCTPLRLAFHANPEPFRGEGGVTDRVLAAFVRTVAPRAGGSNEELARVFADPAYPFVSYRAFFAADLCRRAEGRFGTKGFDSLPEDSRARVIEDGLKDDAIARRLYSGAIFLAQVAVYSGIYDDARGARAINFDGANHGFPPETLTHPVPGWYLPAASSVDGNPR